MIKQTLQGDFDEKFEFTGPWTGLTKRLFVGYYEEDGERGTEYEIADADSEVDQFHIDTYEEEGNLAIIKDAGVEAKEAKKLVKHHLVGERFSSVDKLARHVISFLKKNMSGIDFD